MFHGLHLEHVRSDKRRKGMYDKAHLHNLTLRTVVAMAAIVLLTGCDSQESREQHSAQLLAEQQRQAIQSVADDIETALDKISNNKASVNNPKAVVRQAYDAFLETDVSACPDDFRKQYERVVDSLRQLPDAANDVPSDGVDSLVYLLSQLNSSNPDLQGKSLSRNVEAKVQQLRATTTELKAAARHYGVNASFGW